MTDGQAGWRIDRSIASELDLAIYLSLVIPREGLIEPEEGFRHEAADLIRQVPREWFDDLRGWTENFADWLSVNEYLARWAGVLYGEDYEAATAAMRHLTPGAAYQSLVPVAVRYGLELDPSASTPEPLIALTRSVEDQLMLEADVRQTALPLKAAAATAADTLVGGPLHDRFWHWMDRFYYGVYRGWRESRLDFMADLEERAVEHLGSASGAGVPSVDWMSAENPLVTHPGLRRLVEAGDLTVVFWVEPFGLASTWTHLPGEIKLSFAEPGTLSEQFTIVVVELATIMKALADPTRLRILRLIRHFDLDNTQIASYLNISRPTVSVHARVLREAGLITTERTGRQARHTMNPGAMERVYDALGSLFDVTED